MSSFWHDEHESPPPEPESIARSLECIASQPPPPQENARTPTPPRPPTPTHHPLWNVKLSQEYIGRLVKVVFPDRDVLSIHQLQSGKSYNNRIYFLGPGHFNTRQYVLKVNGRFFGGDKIQNEVSCLRILEKYCPEVPVPRVVAWSENGTDVMVNLVHGIKKREIALDDDILAVRAGWILMTRVPGEPVSNLPSTVLSDTNTAIPIAKQLAEIVATWRSKVPAAHNCGNLRFTSDPSATDIHLGSTTDDQPTPNMLAIRGILADDIPPSNPIPTTRDLHHTRLSTKLHSLQLDDVYTANRNLVPLLADFAETHLPRIFADTEQDPPDTETNTTCTTLPTTGRKFIFTHYDLAPRNVHVQISPNGPPQVVGLVDFEFAGFFPRTEEFVNDEVSNKGDWSDVFYRAYLERLEELGVATPLRGIGEKEWRRERWLARLAENIAPWWLPGGLSDEERAAALEKSAGVVREAVRELRELSCDGDGDVGQSRVRMQN